MRSVRLTFGLMLAVCVVFAQAGRLGGPRPKSASETPVPGDAAHGRALFESRGECLGCHRVGDKGSRIGPDLTDVATRFTADELTKSLLDPSQDVPPQYRLFRVVTRDGATVTGKLLNKDQFSIQMLDSKERLVSFQKANVQDSSFVPATPMPSYKSKLSQEEVTDLIAYLASLKGATRQ
jgi:putative heme-binding domain-containing protein